MKLPRFAISPLRLVVAAWVLAVAATPARAAEPADAAFAEGLQALHARDFTKAIDRFGEAVRLAPKEAKHLGMRAVARLKSGDYGQGAADLRAAIQLNPGDAGTNYRPSSSKPLAGEAFEHGRQHVAQMLKDRPAMADFGAKSEFLRQWATRKFAGEDLGSLVDWDPSPPLHSDAEHLAPGEDEHAAILVAGVYNEGPRRDQPRSFEELWAGAIFELHNVNYAKEFVRLNDEAAKLSKEAFVGSIVRYELRAAQQTRAFYLQVFLPWAEKMKAPTEPALWFCDWWDAPDAVLKNFTDRSAYPWRPYARAHDWATVDRHWRHGRAKLALRLLKQMCGEAGYEDDEADVHYWIGRCEQRLGKPTAAVSELTKSIEINADNPAAFRARGKAYEKLGEAEKARTDREKAKELEKDE